MFSLMLSMLIVGCGVSVEQYNTIVAERDTLKSQLLSTQNELESIKSELTLAHNELAKVEEDNPRLSLSEVKATIATSLYSKLPKTHKTFDESGPLQGEISIREYGDFSAAFVNPSYSGNGEWVFTASTRGAELSMDYIETMASGLWVYQVTQTTFTLKVTGTYFERIHKFDIPLVERIGEKEEVSNRIF